MKTSPALICLFCGVILLLVALVWNWRDRQPQIPEIQNAAIAEISNEAMKDDLAKVEARLKDDPKLVFSTDPNGRTPLHWAAIGGQKDMADLLLAHGAEVNAITGDGKTPLHFAAMMGNIDVMVLLLDNKAKTNIVDLSGKMPSDYAESSGLKDMVELLSRRGNGNGMAEPHPIGNGVTAPVPLIQPLPPYTEEARKARIEGTVVLQAIIRRDGTVDSFKVLKSLGHGLDISAINTIAAKWRFKPGTLKGEPVDVYANIEVRFRMF
jgi:TonB family protein